MGRGIEERDIYASNSVSADLCVQQTGVKVSDVCGASQTALGNAVGTNSKREAAFFGVIAIDTIGILVVCCYLWDKRGRLAGRNAQGNCKPPHLFQENKKEKTEAVGKKMLSPVLFWYSLTNIFERNNLLSLSLPLVSLCLSTTLASLSTTPSVATTPLRLSLQTSACQITDYRPSSCCVVDR
jgi:hypothetical protein